MSDDLYSLSSQLLFLKKFFLVDLEIFNLIVMLFIYLFSYGCVGSSFLRAGFLQLWRGRGYSLLRCAGFSLQWPLLLQSTGSRCVGFSSCGTWAQQLWPTGSRARAQQLWCTGLVAPWYVGSSWTRDQTRIPCIGRRILNHCTTREVPIVMLFERNF